MSAILTTLPGGILFIAIVFLILNKLTHWDAKVIAGLMALLVIGVYVPVAIVFWPGADVFAIHLALYLVTIYVLGIIGMQRASHLQSESSRPWFHWGPAAITGFFLFIVAVDSILIVVAKKGINMDVAGHFLPEPKSGGKVSSFFPGTVNRDYRQKEDQFNDYVAMRDQQQQRNWQVRTGWQSTPYVGKPVEFLIQIQDKDGKPVTGAKASGKFIRPANSDLDLAFSMHEDEAGLYRTRITLSEPGQWQLSLQIKRGEEQHEVRATTEVQLLK